jgi:hypothetical protein
MDRKTAIATAIAITMSLTSGAIALGANAGALGFSRPAPVAVRTVAAISAPSAQGATRTTTVNARGHDDALTNQSSTNAKGEHND